MCHYNKTIIPKNNSTGIYDIYDIYDILTIDGNIQTSFKNLQLTHLDDDKVEGNNK